MKDALDDLSVLARRGELSPAEEQRLAQLLEGSAEAHLFHELGRRFDAEDAASPGAGQASNALAESVLQRLQQPAPRRARPLSPWLMAAAAVLAASLAGAVVVGVQQLRRPSAPASSASARTAALPSAAPAISRGLPPPAPVLTPSAEPPAPALSVEAPAVRSAPGTAAELLSAAGRARRSGQSAQAVELLQTLRTRFPHSAEASTSEITLGDLQLERGAAAAALAHFDGYLRRSAGGGLAPEALWGRARALLQLGRSAEAQHSLRELLQRFPKSPYASAARAKLAAAEAPRP